MRWQHNRLGDRWKWRAQLPLKLEAAPAGREEACFPRETWGDTPGRAPAGLRERETQNCGLWLGWRGWSRSLGGPDSAGLSPGAAAARGVAAGGGVALH